MKLIFCLSCSDVVNLVRHEERRCSCGSCYGMMDSESTGWYKGVTCLPVHFNIGSFADACFNQPSKGRGRMFEAFVLADKNLTLEKRA